MVTPRNISVRNFNNVTPGPVFRTAQAPSNPSLSTSNSLSQIIDQPREAEFVREMVTWKTPHLGYVQMYINPQSISIQDKKDISSTRTKAGFIVQYAGEALTKISINGTTGSAGIEGINILEEVYRAEQIAFEPIADALERNVSTAAMLALFKGTFNIGPTGNDFVDNFVSQSAADAAINIFQQPFPTLASLAANIEMFFQGVNYRGYFESFRVDEKGATPGHFEYSMEFTAYAKQGIRRNFMPWHRQPTRPADWNGPNNMSFFLAGRAQNTDGGILNQSLQTFPESSQRAALAESFQGVRNVRDFNNSLGKKGQNLIALDLRDTEA